MDTSRSAALVVAATALLALPAAADKPVDKKDGRAAPVVLHVGDSFLGAGLAKALKPRFEALGAKYLAVVQTSAYTTTLPRQVNLEELLRTHRPVMVLLTIGANEMAMPNPEEHAHAARNLTRLISSSACVWALPPRWAKETGFRQVMTREAPPCRVHDPEPIADKIERQADKIHPTDRGGKMWADHLWASLMAGKPEGARPWDGAAPAPAGSAPGGP